MPARSIRDFVAMLCTAVVLSACAGDPDAPPVTEGPAELPGLEPLRGQVWGDGPVMAVLLHGDVSRGGPADYLYERASRLAAENPALTVVALLRPGYYDREGRRSPGDNTDRFDHYTSANNALLATTLTNLRTAHGTRRLIALGHSGGAAQLGVVIGKYPGLVDGAVLAACPCDLEAWRQHRDWRPWRNSESP